MRFSKRLAVLPLLLAMLCGLLSTQALARQHMSFAPGDRSRPAFHPMRSGRSMRPARHFGGRHPFHAPPTRHAPQRRGGGADDTEATAPAKPGGGFTMENGVLTYPAPERFQPRNLPHR